jgi:two-component system, NtrC family, sensor histidine kinase HydH
MADIGLMRSSPKEFNLSKRFAFLSFVCIGILTAALWVIVSHYLTIEMLDREWETTAKFIRKETRQFITAQDFAAQNLDAVAEKFKKLQDQIMLIPDIARIKIYNPQGVIVWSDELRLVGTAFTNNPELREALAGKIVADVSSMGKGENVYERDSFQRLVEVYVPIWSEDGRQLLGVVETYKSADSLYRNIQRARVTVLTVTFGGGLLLYLSLFAIVRQAARKIDEQQANLLKMQSELVASQRMAAIGEMVAAVAHGIGNPLSSIRAVAQVAKLDCAEQKGCDQSEKTQRNLQSIIQQVDRVQRRMRGLLNFVSPLQPDPSPVELNSVLQDAVDTLRPRFDEAGVAFHLELDRDLPRTQLDADHLEQVFMGLLTNALEATPRGGRVTISTKVHSLPGDSQGVSVSIEDTGEGIPVENRERIFEPFFTTKPHGTGLGLPLAKKFVERNGGALVISDGSKSGIRVEVAFPRINPSEGQHVEQHTGCR